MNESNGRAPGEICLFQLTLKKSSFAFQAWRAAVRDCPYAGRAVRATIPNNGNYFNVPAPGR